MNMYLDKIINLLSSPVVTSAVTYISLLLTIYFGFKIKRKQIYYRLLLGKEDSYIFFWNGGNTTIFKNDIMYLFCEVDMPSRVVFFYPTDADISLEIKSDPENQRFDLSFDFLNKGEGFYFDLNSRSKEPFANLFGRLRGEKRESVYLLNEPFDNTIVFTAIVVVAAFSVTLFSLVKNNSILDYYMSLMYFLFLVISAINLPLIYIIAKGSRMPSSLKERYTRIKENIYVK